MLKTFETLTAGTMFGSVVAVGTTSPGDVRSLVRAGRLIDVDAPPLDREKWDSPRELLDVAIELLRSGCGARHPLIWVGDDVDPSFPDFNRGVFSCRLDSSGVIPALLALSQSDLRNSALQELSLPVFLFPRLDPDTEQVVAAWVARSCPPPTSPVDKLLKDFLARCDDETVDGFEDKFNHVPLRSRKVTSVLQLKTGVRAVWSGQPAAFEDEESVAIFLSEFWKELCVVRPELAPRQHAQRVRLRKVSVSTAALGIGTHLFVGVELFQRHRVWSPAARAELLASPLNREVEVETSIENAVAALHESVETPGQLSGNRKSSGLETNARERLLIKALVESGWQLSQRPPFDLVRNDEGIILVHGRGQQGQDLAQSQVEPTLSAATDLYLGRKHQVDFFDSSAPWWNLGRCVLDYSTSGGGDLRPAKSILAKRWAGQLAIRLTPRLTPDN